jgi:hypothetical protein
MRSECNIISTLLRRGFTDNGIRTHDTIDQNSIQRILSRLDHNIYLGKHRFHFAHGEHVLETLKSHHNGLEKRSLKVLLFWTSSSTFVKPDRGTTTRVSLYLKGRCHSLYPTVMRWGQVYYCSCPASGSAALNAAETSRDSQICDLWAVKLNRRSSLMNMLISKRLPPSQAE